jgi:hypothetical protein
LENGSFASCPLLDAISLPFLLKLLLSSPDFKKALVTGQKDIDKVWDAYDKSSSNPNNF